MKRIFYFMLLSCMAAIEANASESMLSDTTFRYHNRLINLEDSADQMKVKIYELPSPHDTLPLKQVYEGIYSEEKSYERFMVTEETGFQFPLLQKVFEKRHHNCKMEPHWAGFGMGFASVSLPHELSFTTVDGFELKSEDSYEMFFNLFEKITPILSDQFGITTGMGFNWRKYFLDKNQHLEEINDITTAIPAPEDIHYIYSRLKVVYLTFPLLLEWQPAFDGKHHVYIAAGVIGGAKLLSSSKVKYKNLEGHTIRDVEAKGLNVAPLTMDYTVQAGIKDVSVYAKYAPFGLFQQGKGPDIRPISLGLILNF